MITQIAGQAQQIQTRAGRRRRRAEAAGEAEEVRPERRPSTRSRWVCGGRSRRSGGVWRCRRTPAWPTCTDIIQAAFGWDEQPHCMSSRRRIRRLPGSPTGSWVTAPRRPVTLEQVAPRRRRPVPVHVRLRRRLGHTRSWWRKCWIAEPRGLPAMHGRAAGGTAGGLRRHLGIRRTGRGAGRSRPPRARRPAGVARVWPRPPTSSPPGSTPPRSPEPWPKGASRGLCG